MSIFARSVSKNFASAWSLKNHLEKLYPCDVGNYQCDGCSTKFNNRSNLSTHKKTCKGRYISSKEKDQLIQDLHSAFAVSDGKGVTEMTEMMAALRGQMENFSSSISEQSEAVMTEQACGSQRTESGRIESVTNIIDRRANRFYFSDPPGEWIDIRRIGSNSAIDIERPFWIIKIGWNGEQTSRHPAHDKEYGGTSRIIDSLLTPVAAAAEMKIKDRLVNEGKLFSAKHSNKKARDNELIIIKTQAEYAEVVSMAKSVIHIVEEPIRSDMDCLKMWKDKAKYIDAMYKQTEAMAEHANKITKELEDKIHSMKVI